MNSTTELPTLCGRQVEDDWEVFIMILSCDPPRHAFLIHFGKRQQPCSVKTLVSSYHGALVEIALNTQSQPISLVAVHFVRHGFLLPFINSRDELSINSFDFQSGYRQNLYFFDFVYEPHGSEEFEEWEAFPGLTVLVSRLSHFGPDSPIMIKDRPVLHGLQVDMEALKVDIDMSEFIVECGADNLKDVPVTLFIDWTRV